MAQSTGRYESHVPDDSVTISRIRKEIINQTLLFKGSDIVPIPCHPDGSSIAYALKKNNELIPLLRFVDKADLINSFSDKISFEQDKKFVSDVLKAQSQSCCCSPHSEGCNPVNPKVSSKCFSGLIDILGML